MLFQWRVRVNEAENMYLELHSVKPILESLSSVSKVAATFFASVSIHALIVFSCPYYFKVVGASDVRHVAYEWRKEG